jgi:hypothetical protein
VNTECRDLGGAPAGLAQDLKGQELAQEATLDGALHGFRLATSPSRGQRFEPRHETASFAVSFPPACTPRTLPLLSCMNAIIEGAPCDGPWLAFA